MKKKVRIYKAPDGKGKFVNKTAKFLHKAQQGGQQDQQAQIAQYVYKTLDDAEPFEFDQVKESLIDELAAAKVPIEQAENLVENIAVNLQTQTAQAEQLAGEDQDVYDQGLEELKAQEEAAAAAEEERLAGLSDDYGYYDDTAGEGEDDDEGDDEDDVPESVYMQDGGDVIPEDNPVSFAGYNPDQYAMDKQQSFSYGGMTKRKYVGKVMKLLKKAQEGAETKEDGFDPTDTIDNKKKNLNKGFVNALANTAQEAKMKERAEAMWEQQQQMMMQQQVPQYPMQPPMEQVPMAQRGMSVRQMRRMMPRGFGRNQMQSFAGMVPPGGFFPMGMNIMTYPQMQMPEQKPIHVQGTIPGMKLDVRKSHWLTGRPSQYSIEFGGDGAIPGFNMMPGMGYGTKSTQRRTVEGVSKLVNKIADPANDIKKNEPSFDKDKNNVPDNIQSNVISPATTTPTQYDKNGNGILDVTEVATNLPGVTTTSATTNPNKDAVGKGAKVPTKTATNKTVTASKSKQVGQSKPSVNTTTNNKKTLTSAEMVKKQSNTDWKTSVTPQAPVVKPKPAAPKVAPVADSTPFYAQPVMDVIDWVRKSAGEAASNWGSLFGYESGGFVDSSNPDLYKFIYGGDDAITQQDMDYSDSKNTGSPFFAYGGHIKYQDKGEVKEDDYDKYQREKAEKEALDEYNSFMNRGEGDAKKMVAYKANANDAIYNKILGQTRKKYNIADPNENSSSGIRAKNPTSAINPKTGKQWTWEEWDAPGGGGYEARQKEDAEWKRREQEESNNQGNTYNPYSGYGGYNYQPNAFGRYFPANTVRKLGTWTQQQGMPYDPRTGTGYFGGFGPNTQLSKIDVRKSGWLSGRPKKYTMYFNNPEMDPTKPQFSINTGTTEGEPGTTATGWGDELKTRKEKRQGRRYDRLMEQIKGQTAPEEAMAEEDLTADVKTLPPSQMATSVTGQKSSSLPDVESAQEYNTLYPAGTKSVTGIDSIFEPEEITPNSYQAPEGQLDQVAEAQQQAEVEEDADQNITYDSPEAANEYIQGEWGDIMSDITEVLGEEANTEFNEFLKQNPTKGQIDGKIEELMGKRNAAIGQDTQAVERGNLMATPEEQMINQRSMQANPMFMGSSGYDSGMDMTRDDVQSLYDQRDAEVQAARAAGRQPASLRYGQTQDAWNENTFNPMYNAEMLPFNTGVTLPEQLAGLPQPFMTKAPNDFFGGDIPLDPSLRNDYAQLQQLGPERYYSNRISGINTGVEKREKAEQDAIIAKRNAAMATQQAAAAARQAQSQAQPASTGISAQEQAISNVSGAIIQAGKDLDSFANSTRAGEYYTEIKKVARMKGINPDKDEAAFKKMLKGYGWDKFYDKYKNRGKKQFGGDSNLTRFVYGDEVTQTSTGKDSPIVYTNNPALEGIRDVDIVGPNTEGITNLQPSSFWSDQQSFNQPTMDFQSGCTEEEKKDPKSPCYDMEKYGMKVQKDALGSARETTEKTYAPAAGEFAVDFKNKNAYEVDAQGVLNAGNAAARGILNFFEKRGQRRQNKNFYDRFTSDNLYADDTSRDRGDYDTNTGLYRPDEQGQVWNSRSKRYGGFMQTGGFVEGDVIDMTPEELEEFLANGGEVEIIS
jgi:hypothetical protein